MTGTIIAKAVGRIAKTHVELAALNGWGPMAEHQLMTLESCFSFAFPNTTMPYLDFLSEQGIEASPYSIFQSVSRVVQRRPEPSGLLVEFVETGLKKIGERYVAYLKANELLLSPDRAFDADRLRSTLLTLLDQQFAMALSPERFGNAIQSEAGAIVIDRLLGSILGTDTGMAFTYHSFTKSLVGHDSFVQSQMHEGLHADAWMNGLKSHWERYLKEACLDSHDLQKAKSQAKFILNELFP